jgi:hypothetical protein
VLCYEANIKANLYTKSRPFEVSTVPIRRKLL